MFLQPFLNDAAEDGLRNILYLEYQCVSASEGKSVKSSHSVPLISHMNNSNTAKHVSHLFFCDAAKPGNEFCRTASARPVC